MLLRSVKTRFDPAGKLMLADEKGAFDGDSRGETAVSHMDPDQSSLQVQTVAQTHPRGLGFTHEEGQAWLKKENVRSPEAE